MYNHRSNNMHSSSLCTFKADRRLQRHSGAVIARAATIHRSYFEYVYISYVRLFVPEICQARCFAVIIIADLIAQRPQVSPILHLS